LAGQDVRSSRLRHPQEEERERDSATGKGEKRVLKVMDWGGGGHRSIRAKGQFGKGQQSVKKNPQNNRDKKRESYIWGGRRDGRFEVREKVRKRRGWGKRKKALH